VLAFAAGTAHAHDGAIGSFGAHNDKPHFLSGPMSSKYYGAGDCPIVGTWCGEAGDDLLTGGLGATGLLLAAPAFANALAPTPAELRRNVEAVQLDARLRGTPTLIVHGSADALIPVNHSSRAYYGANLLNENHGRRSSPTRYVEVTNAQHFDAFLSFPGYPERYVPLHVYLIRALNTMHAHLTQHAPLPPSQVVRTVPRGAGALAITAANVPAWQEVPLEGDRIGFQERTLFVPD
jgi:hydroxybutyrate-dimer hydrolase